MISEEEGPEPEKCVHLLGLTNAQSFPLCLGRGYDHKSDLLPGTQLLHRGSCRAPTPVLDTLSHHPCSINTGVKHKLPARLPCRTLLISMCWEHRHPAPHPSVPTVKAAPTVLVVDVLCEAILLEQLVRRMLELRQGLRGAAVASNGRGPLRGAGAEHKRLPSTPFLGNTQLAVEWGHTPPHSTCLLVPLTPW